MVSLTEKDCYGKELSCESLVKARLPGAGKDRKHEQCIVVQGYITTNRKGKKGKGKTPYIRKNFIMVSSTTHWEISQGKCRELKPFKIKVGKVLANAL